MAYFQSAFYSAAEFKTIHIGHICIADDKVCIGLFKQVDSFNAVMSGQDKLEHTTELIGK